MSWVPKQMKLPSKCKCINQQECWINKWKEPAAHVHVHINNYHNIVCACIHAYMCVCMCLCVCVSACLCTHTMHMHACVQWVCVCVCIRIPVGENNNKNNKTKQTPNFGGKPLHIHILHAGYTCFGCSKLIVSTEKPVSVHHHFETKSRPVT